MRVAALSCCILVAATTRSDAGTAPGWNDVPALIAFATQSVDKDLRACTLPLRQRAPGRRGAARPGP